MQHSFDKDIAVKYGLVEAIIINHFEYWIEQNKANGKNFYDGRYWTYNSVKAYEEIFPYLTSKKIRNALKNLQDNGIIVTGNYNKLAYDRTLWYAFTEKGESILLKSQMENEEKENVLFQKVKPIPDNKPINKPFNYTNNNIKKERSKKQTVECFESIAEEMLNGYSDGVLDITKQWLQYKSERKEPYTPTGLKSLINRIIKNINQYGSEKVIDVIDQSISSGYMGITWDKLNKSTEKSLNKQDNGSIMELKLLGHRQDYSPEEIRQKEYFIEEWEREMLDE